MSQDVALKRGNAVAPVGALPAGWGHSRILGVLTDQIIEATSARPKAYKLADSGGLYIYITPTGYKSWRLKYRTSGRERRLVLGPYPVVSIAEARHMAQVARDEVRARRDPRGCSRDIPLHPGTLARLEDIPVREGDPDRVYFIQAGSGPIKIGVSRNPAARRRALQLGHPEPLRLLGQMAGSYAAELIIQRMFAEQRISGEWYTPSDRLLEFISEKGALRC
jgi:hypothetical protein